MQILIIISFILLIRSIYKSKRYESLSKRMLMIYSILWGIVISISSFGLYDFKVPSSNILLMMVVHVFAFVLGFRSVLISRKDADQFSLDLLDKKLDRLTSNLVFIIFTSLLSAYILFLVIKMFSLIAVMNMSDIRDDYYDSNIYGSLFSIINGPILATFNLFLIPVFSWMCFKKRNWFTLIQGLYLFGYSSLGGGRFGFVRIGVGLLFVGFCLYLNKYNKSKRIRQLLFLSSGIVFLIGIMTTLRLNVDTKGDKGLSNAVESTSRQILSYAVGPISAFDYAVNYHYEYRIGGFKYGGLTFSAPESFVYIVLNKVGVKYNKALDQLVVIKQDENIDIGDNTWWNALYTSLLYYYFDLGWIGIIIFPFMFGVLFRYCIKKMFETNSLCCYIIVAYVFHEILRSITDYTFVDVFVFILMVTLFFLSSKRLIV